MFSPGDCCVSVSPTAWTGRCIATRCSWCTWVWWRPSTLLPTARSWPSSCGRCPGKPSPLSISCDLWVLDGSVCGWVDHCGVVCVLRNSFCVWLSGSVEGSSCLCSVLLFVCFCCSSFFSFASYFVFFFAFCYSFFPSLFILFFLFWLSRPCSIILSFSVKSCSLLLVAKFLPTSVHAVITWLWDAGYSRLSQPVSCTHAIRTKEKLFVGLLNIPATC